MAFAKPALFIKYSVGAADPAGVSSTNDEDDVRAVQYLLNLAAGSGLATNGVCDQSVIDAITAFQNAVVLPSTGRIAPSDPTLQKLNLSNIPDSFLKVDDGEEQSSVIRRNAVWNFSRGDYMALTRRDGGSLRFDVNSAWLPEKLKARLLLILGSLLFHDDAGYGLTIEPSTWGVSTQDWYHCHLGLWSGVPQKKLSSDALTWATQALALHNAMNILRNNFTNPDGMPAANVSEYRAAYGASVIPAAWHILGEYAELDEAVMFHHTFESVGPLKSRPKGMADDNARRHWMVLANSEMAPNPYRKPDEQNQARQREEMAYQNTIDLNFLIDKAGIIHPVLGATMDLVLVTNTGTDALYS